MHTSRSLREVQQRTVEGHRTPECQGGSAAHPQPENRTVRGRSGL
jgi:hypothetical protein